MQAKAKKEDKFKRRLKKVLATENLQLQRELIKRVSKELNVSIEECAAALVYMSQPNLYETVNNKVQKVPDNFFEFEVPLFTLKDRTVPYRIEVGSNDHLTREELIELLVDETGVDPSRIKKIDILQHYTIVELPEGMPSEIYQLLNEAELRQKKIKIKRLKPVRKFKRVQPRLD